MSEAAVAPEFESLPVLYQRWVTELLPGGIPREHVASCMDCVMCDSCEPGTYADPQYFNPDSKCCTYFPGVPNFLVGRAIHADTPGSEVLREFVEAGDSDRTIASLLQVRPSPAVSAHHSNQGDMAFGRNADLLCPYAIETDTYEGPLCGIWQHRNAVCSTYFCKHVRGGTGHRFWQALRNLFIAMEEALEWWAVAELIPEAGEKILYSPADDVKRLELVLKSGAWQHWPGTRKEFYEACAEKVEALSWEEALAIAGIKGKLHAGEVLARYRELVSPEFPTRLKIAPYKVLSSDGPKTMIESTTHREQLNAPSALIPLLRYFDGRPMEEVLAEIEREEKIELDTSLVRRLYDFGILMPVGE